MKMTMEVRLGNAAMRTRLDVLGAVAAALGKAGPHSVDDELELGDEGPLTDSNGNTVGEWRVTATGA